MDDLISRQAVIELLEEWADGYSYLEVPVDSIADKLNELPAADLSEYCDKLWKEAYERGKEEARPKGKWIGIDDEPCEVWECDKCGHIVECDATLALPNYCENCGADMRGEEDERPK